MLREGMAYACRRLLCPLSSLTTTLTRTASLWNPVQQIRRECMWTKWEVSRNFVSPSLLPPLRVSSSPLSVWRRRPEVGPVWSGLCPVSGSGSGGSVGVVGSTWWGRRRAGRRSIGSRWTISSFSSLSTAKGKSSVQREDVESAGKSSRKWIRGLMRWILYFHWFLLLGYTISTHIAADIAILGVSMYPTLNPMPSQANENGNTDHVFVLRPFLHRKGPDRGDVIVFQSPTEPEKTVIKRVIGLPGDVIKLRDFGGLAELVPPGCVWVEGDNGLNSNDSNSYGPLPISGIDGYALWITYPFSRMSAIPREIPPSIQERLYSSSS